MLDAISAVTAVVAVLDALGFLYGAYWALEIGRALGSPLYSKQALWVGAIGVYFTAFFVLSAVALALGLPGFGGTTATDIAVGAFLYIGVLMFFVWIDSTVKVARRSDPLRRNTLRWSGLRWFLGIFVGVGTLFALAFNIGTAVDFAHATPLYGPIGGVLFLGAIALLLSARRSGDPILKRHLKWFGLFAVLLWATSGVEGTSVFRSAANDPFILAVSYLVFAVSAYFLYRSARSLAPMAQLPPQTET
jgi:hypothetical protein